MTQGGRGNWLSTSWNVRDSTAGRFCHHEAHAGAHKAIASKANADALAAEKAKDTAEAEIAAYQRALDAKRRRVEEPAIDEAAEPEQVTTEWDLADHRRDMSRVMNRRDIEIGSDERERELRTGRDGYLHHPCPLCSDFYVLRSNSRRK